VVAPSLDADTVGTDLLTTMARVTRWAGRQAQLALPVAQLRVLSHLDDLGPTRISALAAVDRCAQPTMSVLVQRLEEHGLVDRQADPDDTRASVIRLNADGRRALRAARLAAGRPIARRLTAGGEAEVRRAAEAVALLRRLLDDEATKGSA
jgi:DNA-binding MarR family transcriptional regulator